MPAFERWAYQLKTYDAWPRFPNAWAYTALVGAEVLLSAGLKPEAEVLLTDHRVFRQKILAPYLALGLARADLIAKRPGEIETLLAPMTREERNPYLLGAGLLLRALAATQRSDIPKVETIAREGLQRVGPEPWLARLWILGGEAALGSGRLADARRFLQLAERGARGVDSAVTRLRLGDLAVRLDGARGLEQARRLYDSIDTRDLCYVEVLTLRLRMISNPRAADLSEWLEQRSTSPACPAVRSEALFALARFHLASQADTAALGALSLARASDELPWGSAGVLTSLEQEILANGIRRRARARDWAAVIRFYEDLVETRDRALPPEAVKNVARAYQLLGAPADGARVLLQLTKLLPPGPEQDDSTLFLARLYLEAGDLPRAKLVTRFFLARRTDSVRLFELQLLEAERALMSGEFDDAEVALKASENLAIPGYVDGEHFALSAELAARRGNADRAAEHLLSAVGQEPRPDLDRRGLGVDVTSLCARKCSLPVLERLLNFAETHEGGKLATERILHLAAQRGLRSKREGSPPAKSIWNDLQAIAKDLPTTEMSADGKPSSQARAPSSP